MQIDGGLSRGTVGGVASVLGGGKFANGAITSSFEYMFNACFHGQCTGGFGLGAGVEQALYDWFPGFGATGCGMSAIGFGNWECSGYDVGIKYLETAVSFAGALPKLAALVSGSAVTVGTSSWPAAVGGRAVINGIEYTTHVLERMQPVGTIINDDMLFSRGVPPSVVENAIQFGQVTPGNTTAEVVRTFENVRVIINPAGTRVISVIKTR